MNKFNVLLENIIFLRPIRAPVAPNNKVELKLLTAKLVKLLRTRKAKLSNKYMLTPSNRFILSKPTGGYLRRNNNVCIPAKRPSTINQTKAAKRQKLIETLKRKWEEDVDRIYRANIKRAIKRRRIAAILELVNVE